MTSRSNLKNLEFAAAVTPKSLSRVCATIVVCIVATGFGNANADIIADRKAKFKANADSMRAIATTIGGGDYKTVISLAEGIASWAKKIPSYFPEEAIPVTPRRAPKYGLNLTPLMPRPKTMKPPRKPSSPPPSQGIKAL